MKLSQILGIGVFSFFISYGAIAIELPDPVPAADAGQQEAVEEAPLPPREEQPVNEERWSSIVKVFSVCSSPNFYQPWQNYAQRSGVGSGFVIEGNRIITNAHVVADQTFLMVRRPGDQQRYIARLLVVGHDCDLAILTVDDPNFFKNITPLAIGTLPDMQSSVSVLGYPIGGDNISVTEGVISRVEPVIYSHSGRRLLAAQIDAAINPGNSGGPVLHDGKVVGVAFQGLSKSQNIGFMIPAPVLEHFLNDTADNDFDGFPDIPFRFMKMENPDLRAARGMKPDQTGIMITKLPPAVEALKLLQENDVVMAIDGVPIANDATVPFRDGEVIFFGELIWRKYLGDTSRLTILRDGRQLDVDFKLLRLPRLVRDRSFDRAPTYYFIGGMVFVPLSINYLDEWEEWYQGPIELVSYVLDNQPTPELEEVVVLSMVLADSVNVGYQDLSAQPVISVNGTNIKNLRELIRLVQAMPDGFLELGLKNGDQVVLDINKIREATPEIMTRYRIPQDRSEDLADTDQVAQPQYGPLKQ